MGPSCSIQRAASFARRSGPAMVLAVLLAAWMSIAGRTALADPPDFDGSSAGDSPGGAARDDEPIPQKSLLEMIRAGGPVMIPLLGCSIILLVFVFERAMALRRGNVVPRPFVKRFMHQLREGKLGRQAALEL